MTEFVEFTQFVTKGIKIERDDDRRIFKGHITAEIIDRQQEFIFVKEVMGIMDAFMKVNPVISDEHTNRMVGRVLDYEKSEIGGVASVMITAEIYKSDTFELYDRVWKKIQSGEYSGLSMGGASKEREPIEKNGRMALELRKLELYEIAVCKSPANSFAIIENVNMFAKNNNLSEGMVHNIQGRDIIQCTSIACKFEKGTDMDDDVDVDNDDSKKESTADIEKDHIPSTPESVEDKAKEKITDVEKLSSTSLVGQSATTRASGISQTASSPKEINDVLSQISSVKKQLDDIIKQYMPFNKPIKGHTRDHWQTKLREEDPNRTESDVDTIIAGYEEEEKLKKEETKAKPVEISSETPSETPVEKSKSYKELESLLQKY